jgi:hypothetical protein
VRRAGQAGSAVGNRQDHCELCAVERDEARNWHEASRNEKGQDGGFVQFFFPFLSLSQSYCRGPCGGFRPGVADSLRITSFTTPFDWMAR